MTNLPRTKRLTPDGAKGELLLAVARSKDSLGLIGEGDWTPQDTLHAHLIEVVEAFLVTTEKA